jgi:glycerate kinase
MKKTMNLFQLVEYVKITAMCDVDNPLFGDKGASCIFAPQKGADAEMVGLLDAQLRYVAELVKKKLKRDVSNLPGAGAAGGLGFGVIAFMNGELRSGINVILDLADFDNVISDCDLVITGEGRIDGQSIDGKVISGIAKRTSAQKVPLVAIVGDVLDDAYAAYDIGVTAIFSINRLAIPFSEAKERSRQDYIRTFEDVMRLVAAIKNQ